jgi:chromosome segregation ATPase
VSTLAVSLLVLAVGGGGIVGAIVAFRKLVPERESIIVTAAQGAIVIQGSVLDELREEIDRLNSRLQEVRDDAHELRQEVGLMRLENETLRADNTRLHRENRKLLERIELLEQNDGRETP